MDEKIYLHKISEKEAEEGLDLASNYASLNTLLSIVSKENKDDIIGKIKEDMAYVNEKHTEYWERISNKYSFPLCVDSGMYIDHIKNMVYTLNKTRK